MNCQDVKNSIREASDLNSLGLNQEISPHLENCKDCMAFLKYEKKLRSSFKRMSEEMPPAQLAERIFSVPEKEKLAKNEKSEGFWVALAHLFQGFSLKTAVTFGLIGFFAAIIMQRAGHIEQLKPETTTKTEMAKIQAKPDRNLVQKKRLRASIPQKTESKSIINESDEQIPGAISFSIAQEAQETRETLTESKTMQMTKPAMSKRSLAAAPAMSRKDMIEAETAFSDSFVAEPESIKSEKNADRESRQARDPRCDELQTLINNYELRIEDGVLELENLAARGIIPTERLSYFMPPPGMNWFVENSISGPRIFLKREK
jgi:hypothetical protein